MPRFKYIGLCFIYILILSPRLQGQDFRFAHLGEEEGLHDNRQNRFVKKDSRGFIWISSQQGVYRFDGQETKLYQINKSEGYDQNIQSDFFEDEERSIWFTTGNSLHKYDYRIDDFVSIRILDDSLALEPPFNLFHLEKNTSLMWLSNPQYIWVYDRLEKTSKPEYISSKSYRYTVQTTSMGSVERIFGFPWIMETGLELITKDDNGDWQSELLSSGLLGSVEVSNGLLQGDSTLWLISNQGLIAFDINNNKVKGQFKVPGSKTPKLSFGVFLNAEQLIVSSDENGLWLFDTVKQKYLQSWKYKPNDTKSLSSNSPKVLYISPDGQLWVGHDLIGLDYASINSLPFKNPLNIKEGNFSIREYGIHEDGFHRIWILTKKEGIFVFDTNRQLLQRFKNINGLDSKDFEYLSIDEEGTVWLVALNSIYKFEGESVLETNHWEMVIEDSISMTSICHLADQRKLLTSPSGVYELENQNGSFDLARIAPFDNYKDYDFTYLFSCNDSLLFAPFKNYHLWLLNTTSKNIYLQDSLALNAQVFDVLIDKVGQNGWMASYMGLSKYTIDRDGKIQLSKTSVLPPDVVAFAIQKDESSLLWCTSDNGLWSFDEESKQSVKYTSQDGLDSDIFVWGATLMDTSGQVWLGHEKGLAVFDPDKVELDIRDSKIYINKFWLNDRLVSTIDSLAIDVIDTLRLEEAPDKLSFDIRAIGFPQTNQGNVSFRLKNYLDDWTILRSGDLASFTKVPPGEYILEAKSIDLHQQSGTIKQLHLIIPIPLWQRTWFRLLLLGVFLLFVMAMIRLYFIQKLRKQKRLLEKQKTINSERDRIAKELHDDMGSGLSSILFISEDMVYEAKDNEVENRANRITDLTREALMNMRDIIWAMDTKQSRVQDLNHRVQIFAKRFMMDHKIEFNIILETISIDQISLGSEKKRNILLIVKECLHNIVKHAQASEVAIRIYNEDDFLIFEIKDNGLGFIESNVKKGNGLLNLRHRAKDINARLDVQSSKNQGTRLRLSVPL